MGCQAWESQSPDHHYYVLILLFLLLLLLFTRTAIRPASPLPQGVLTCQEHWFRGFDMEQKNSAVFSTTLSKNWENLGLVSPGRETCRGFSSAQAGENSPSTFCRVVSTPYIGPWGFLSHTHSTNIIRSGSGHSTTLYQDKKDSSGGC